MRVSKALSHSLADAADGWRGEHLEKPTMPNFVALYAAWNGAADLLAREPMLTTWPPFFTRCGMNACVR